MPDLEGRVALVTGASRGIGAATSRMFAARGARVIVLHRSSSRDAETVVAGLDGTGHRAVQCDVSDTDSLVELYKDISANEAFISYLVNNAGWTTVVPHHDLAALTDEIIERNFQVNSIGPLKVCRELASLLRADKPGGAIVNISSVAAHTGLGSSIAYSASKLAVESITQCLARVFAPDIRVMAVAPGLTRTAMAANWTEDEIAERVKSFALKRVADPEEIADVIVRTAADQTYCTGSTIMADGGRLLY